MIGQHKRNFELVPYQNDWNDHFKRERGLLFSILGEKVLRIEHIGSTSIQGMSAKAIIDIMVAVPYEYKPFDTISERMFFSKESPPEHRTHHLNLSKLESSYWINQLLFRDYLKENDQLASEYIQLKERFAEFYARTNHVDLEWKSAFVAKVLKLAKDDIRR